MKFKEEEMDFLETSASSSEHTFFAKYLTSQKVIVFVVLTLTILVWLVCRVISPTTAVFSSLRHNPPEYFLQNHTHN
jgi:hypothetical protein